MADFASPNPGDRLAPLSKGNYTQLSMTPAHSNLEQRIWQVVMLIPRGKVATYGDIARQAGLGRAARRVGHSLRCLPDDTTIPWHRVVNARGSISLPEGSSSRDEQRDRLQEEGVAFRSNQRLDLELYRWRPG